MANFIWACTHRYRQQHAGAFDLAHLRDAARVVGLELVDDIPALADDADRAIVAA